ncbi:mediator of RNA polymerase II transcription subunit 19 [Mytilus galloprovincialis]|uniref:Mediator of RNA polymerase II transcription subunit 19 n=1 Tax=Mytilus galloprovincialis TaxID=29158 RepID=A0A8B6EPH7_MYTGA|nr:mediator of RNA polymerase II transcription subunit 19 [Mytilus galloprovincialis]
MSVRLKGSSLRSVAENPPKANKDLQPLSGGALSGFRLHPGPIPEQYRFMSQMPKKKHKPKKRKEERSGALQDSQDNSVESKDDKVKKKAKQDAEQKKDKREKKDKKKEKRMKDKDDDSQS